MLPDSLRPTGLSPAKEHQVASLLNPYISFDGNAREALTFYEQVFGGTLKLSTFGEFGAEGPTADLIMHGQLDTPSGFTLMGADTPEGMPYTVGTNMAVSLSGDDADDLRRYWSHLAEGGTVSVPLEKQMWGDEFGACTDRYGIGWMVNIGQSQS
jgi:PhnB protein